MAPRHGGTTAEKYKALPLMPDDARPYEVQLEQANAQFQTASATVALANKQLDRSASCWHGPSQGSSRPSIAASNGCPTSSVSSPAA